MRSGDWLLESHTKSARMSSQSKNNINLWSQFQLRIEIQKRGWNRTTIRQKPAVSLTRIDWNWIVFRTLLSLPRSLTLAIHSQPEKSISTFMNTRNGNKIKHEPWRNGWPAAPIVSRPISTDHSGQGRVKRLPLTRTIKPMIRLLPRRELAIRIVVKRRVSLQ